MPYMTNGKRNYQKENLLYKSKPEQIAKRVARNKARRHFLAQGLVHRGDNLEVDHRVPLGFGGSTGDSNLRIRTASANHSFHRTASGKMKYKDQS